MEGRLTDQVNHMASWRDPTDHIKADAPIDLSTSLEAAKYNPIASNAMYMDFKKEMQSDNRIKILVTFCWRAKG